MASYDISRAAFDPRKHYTSVRMQQGRVTVDDDWNENERIENEDRRRSRADIIGPYGSPDNGFRIENPNIANGAIDFDIQAGALYLGGLRLELESAEAYQAQKDWLQQPQGQDALFEQGDQQEQFDLVYLEAWEQPVSAVEDEELLEKALGVDTSTRIRAMSRARIHPNVGLSDCGLAWRRFLSERFGSPDDEAANILNEENELVPQINLSVSFNSEGSADDLCSPFIQGGYLGAENQAIRVQLVDGKHFTWGFDNAAPLYRVRSIGENEIEILTEPKDEYHWPRTGQTVEFLPWSAHLPNGEKVAEVRGRLAKVASYDPASQILQAEPEGAAIDASFGNNYEMRSDVEAIRGSKEAPYFFMRVWNRGAALDEDAAISITGGAIPLGHTGLSVTIAGDGLQSIPAEYLSGYYWTIAARPETPDVIVPWQLMDGMAPHGIRRFLAPLAIVRWRRTQENRRTLIQGEVILDCRKTFRPLAGLESCCAFSVGDGINSHGDFNSLEEAIRNLPPRGGQICVLPGTHDANVSITGQQQIWISGCGERSVLRPQPESLDEPIFRIASSQNIRIGNLQLLALEGSAIVLEDEDAGLNASSGITIKDNHFIAYRHAVWAHALEEGAADNNIEISGNRVSMIDREGGGPAIFCVADGVRIAGNQIVVLAAEPSEETPVLGLVSNSLLHYHLAPCPEPLMFYTQPYNVALLLDAVNQHQAFSNLPELPPATYQSLGGIQIGGTSERVCIKDNEIIGGSGNGITFGHFSNTQEDDNTSSEPSQPRAGIGSMSINAFRAVFATNSKVDSKIATIAATIPKEETENSFRSTLYDIAVEGNHIRNMGLSGIGVVSFLDMGQVEWLVNIEGMSVYRNKIIQCAHQVLPEITKRTNGLIGFGGIGLAGCSNAAIQENRIENNGFNHLYPACGIFIYHGDKVEISGNRILENGPYDPEAEGSTQPGERGGIIIKMSTSFNQPSRANNELSDGIPAIKIHNNIVSQPLGHALSLSALGSVSVVGNQLTSQGVDMSNALSRLATGVLIVNSGINQLAPSNLRSFRNRHPRALAEDLFLSTISRSKLPGGDVLFTNNQVQSYFRASRPQSQEELILSSHLIASMGDVSFNSNQSRCDFIYDPNSVTALDILNTRGKIITNTVLVGENVRSNDNAFYDFLIWSYSLLSRGRNNIAAGNYAVQCLHVFGDQVVKRNNIVEASDCESSSGVILGALGYVRNP